MKRHLAVAAALLGTLLVGWLWGASGRWELDRALQAAAVRGDLLEAHVSLLGAHIGLCNADVGETIQRLEHARGFARRAGTRFGDAGLNDEFPRLDLAAFDAGIDEAMQLAARLAGGANRAARVHGPA
jgi:hypothetical protein